MEDRENEVNRMGIEQCLNLIVYQLGRIADAQERMRAVAEWNRDRLLQRETGEQPDAAPEVPRPATPGTRAAAEEEKMSYDQLKFVLIQRGVEIKKGTKMTTLRKLWEEHKNDPLKPGANTVDGVEASKAEAAAAGPDPDEVPAEEPEAPVEEPAAPAEPMTRAEAVAKISAAFQKPSSTTPAEAAAVRAAFSAVGAEDFTGVPEEKLAEMVTIALKNLAAAHDGGEA